MNPGATPTTSMAARKVIVLPEHDRSFAPTGAQWRGITWLDVPGHDVPIKKLNFALLKRGKLDRYKECAGLHGAALRQRLNEISERIRGNSHMMMMDRNSDQVAQVIQDWLAAEGLWR